MMNLLKPYVDEEDYDAPLEQDMKKPHKMLNTPELDCSNISDSNNDSIKPPPRPIATPFVMLNFPRYVPGRRLFWIEQIEAFFRIAGIDTDEERFDYVVLHADTRFFAPYFDRVFQFPKRSQPRTWLELKDFLWRYVPHERSYTLYAAPQSESNKDIPEKSYNPETKLDSSTKTNVPMQSYNPEELEDSPKKSNVSMKSFNLKEYSDSPKKSSVPISCYFPPRRVSSKKSEMSKNDDSPIKNDITKNNGTPKKSDTTKKIETPKKRVTPKKNNTPKANVSIFNKL